ncbi:MAG: hypothetical protein F6J95_007490 [Leptolyngbya sp. SIO1E4]|nr:hypothetical protein [Leptolyngbya sp. SIO1E4]
MRCRTFAETAFYSIPGFPGLLESRLTVERYGLVQLNPVHLDQDRVSGVFYPMKMQTAAF